MFEKGGGGPYIKNLDNMENNANFQNRENYIYCYIWEGAYLSIYSTFSLLISFNLL